MRKRLYALFSDQDHLGKVVGGDNLSDKANKAVKKESKGCVLYDNLGDTNSIHQSSLFNTYLQTNRNTISTKQLLNVQN